MNGDLISLKTIFDSNRVCVQIYLEFDLYSERDEAFLHYFLIDGFEIIIDGGEDRILVVAG